MPKNLKYSFLTTTVIEKMDNISISPSNTPSKQQCPINSVIDTSDESPNPIEKPCKCIGKNKWVQLDGSC